MNLEARYRTLLRWYPPAWRSSHGDVLLGTFMDAAEADGRTAPTPAEAWSIRWTGMGERFTVTASLVATVSALLAILTHTAVVTFGLSSIAQIGAGWIPAALGQFLAPLLLSFAALCLLRHSRIILPGRAVTALACAVPAWLLAAVAAVSWSVRFDEADTGGITSPFALSFPALFTAAWIVGGGAVFVVTHAILRKLPRGARWAATGVAALLTPPVLGVAVISPMTTTLACLILLFLCGVKVQPGRSPARAYPRPTTRAIRRRVAIFSVITLIASVVSVAFALTGGSWSAGIDSTTAMQLGLGAGQLSAIPLLFCMGWILQNRRPMPATHRWLPVVMLALGLAITVLDTVLGFSSSGGIPWPGIVLITTGLAIATFQMLRMTGGVRVILAVATGLALLFPAWVAVVMIGFSVPIVATIMMIWGMRRRRVHSVHSLEVAPQFP